MQKKEFENSFFAENTCRYFLKEIPLQRESRLEKYALFLKSRLEKYIKRAKSRLEKSVNYA